MDIGLLKDGVFMWKIQCWNNDDASVFFYSSYYLSSFLSFNYDQVDPRILTIASVFESRFNFLRNFVVLNYMFAYNENLNALKREFVKLHAADRIHMYRNIMINRDKSRAL